MTPTPSPCLTDTDQPCPYHAEVELVRAWRASGLDEMLIVSRRRERWQMLLVGALLAAIVTISATAIWGGVTLAGRVGEFSGTSETRLNNVETIVRSNQGEIDRIDRGSTDARSTILVQLGRITERLDSINDRMERAEDENNNSRRR